MKQIPDVTYHIQYIHNQRKRMVVYFDRLKLFKGHVQVKESINTDLTHLLRKDTYSSSPSLTSQPLELYDDDDDDEVDNEEPASVGQQCEGTQPAPTTPPPDLLTLFPTKLGMSSSEDGK